MALVDAYKKVVDTLALPTEVDKVFYSNVNLQHKCLFEIILYPEHVTSLLDPKVFLSAAMDYAVTRFYLYSIQEIPLISIEGIRLGGLQGVKDLIYPETFTATFLSDGTGLVKRYFRTWIDSIASYSFIDNDYYFNDDQYASKRVAIIIPINNDATPSTEWIKINGMKIKNVTGITYDHQDPEHELITAEFICDNARLFTILPF